MSTPVKVLVVEDDPALAGSMERILADAGYMVRREAAIAPAEAETLSGSFDVVLLGSQIAGAAALCERIKSHEPCHHVQILVVTPFSGRGATGREFRIWADEFVKLPVTGPDLLRKVKAQVRIRQCQENLTHRGGDAVAPKTDAPCPGPDDAGPTIPSGPIRAIAHELNQPLTSIMGYAEMLKRRLADGSPERRFADTIHSESERLSVIIRRLGRLARGEPPGDGGDGTS